jgi:hypothetical protein
MFPGCGPRTAPDGIPPAAPDFAPPVVAEGDAIDEDQEGTDPLPEDEGFSAGAFPSDAPERAAPKEAAPTATTAPPGASDGKPAPQTDAPVAAPGGGG